MKKILFLLTILIVTSCGGNSRPQSYCEILADRYSIILYQISNDYTDDKSALHSIERQMERANCGCDEKKTKHDTDQRKDTTKTSM